MFYVTVCTFTLGDILFRSIPNLTRLLLDSNKLPIYVIIFSDFATTSISFKPVHLRVAGA